MLVNKSKKAVLSLILSLIIPLTSCGAKSNEKIDDSTSTAIEASVEELTFDDTYKEKEQRKFALEYFQNYLDSIYTEYPLIDFYLSEEAINNLITSANTNTRCLKTYPKDVDAIISRIKTNSENFLKRNSSFDSAFLSNDSNSEQNELFEKALYETISIMLKEETDLNEDIHRMEGLSIVFGDGSRVYDENYLEKIVLKVEDAYFVLGFYDTTINLMVIDPCAIMLVSEIKGEMIGIDSFYEILLSTVMHEFNHVRQSVCDCRKEQNNALLSSFRYDNFSSSALTESAAESELYNLNKFPYNEYRTSDDYSYMNERNQEAIIFLMALFNEHANVSDYYKAIFDTDYQELYNFLNLTSREDIKKFYNALYSMDAIGLRNDLVLRAYNEEERETKTLYDFRCDLGYDYLIEIYRFVLNHMSTYTYNHPDLSLEDNLVLLSIVQDIVCDTYFTVGDEESENYQRLKDNLINMDYAYKTFLCDVYSVDMDYISSMGTNIFDYEMTLSDRANNQKSYIRSYNKKSDELLRRFPILKAILKNRGYFFGNYERVLTNGDNFSLRLE